MAATVHSPATSPVVGAAPRRTSRALAQVLRLSLVVAAVVLGGLATWRFAHSSAAPVVRTQTAAVDRGSIAAKVTASGALSALVTVQVGSQVSGRILAWYADFNAPVKKGQLIATLEPSLFAAAVAQARANYASAGAGREKALASQVVGDRNYARELALFHESLASRSDLDTAEAQAESARADVQAAEAAIRQARAALDQADLSLSYTKIISPIDGIVISRAVDVGQTVAASFQAPTLFTIAQDLTRMQVDTSVAEGDVGKIQEGMAASFTVDAFPTRTYRGVVRQVRDNAQTVQNVVTYDAVIDVDNSDLSLRPTMTANCIFVYATREDVTRVPNAALRFRPDGATVAAMTAGATMTGTAPRGPLAADERVLWLTRAGVRTSVVARLGISDGMVTEVLQGDVRPGDAVITEAAVPAAAHH